MSPLSSGSKLQRSKTLTEAGGKDELVMSPQLFYERMLICISYTFRNINIKFDVTVLFCFRQTVSGARVVLFLNASLCLTNDKTSIHVDVVYRRFTSCCYTLE
jgi:hypothetical protein